MRRLIFATLRVSRAARAAVILAPALSLGSAAVIVGQGEPATGPLGQVPRLLSLTPVSAQRYRIVPLSGTLVYAVFASAEDRSALLEGIPRERVPELRGSVPVWLSDQLLSDAFADVAPGGGPVGELRDALVGAGIALPPKPGKPTAVVTAVDRSDVAELFDFSMSKMQEGIVAREEGLDRLEGRNAAETAALKFAGPDHPTIALFEPWRFDDLPDAIEDKDAEAAEAARLSEVRRARFEVEVVRALFHVDLFYEDAVLEWLEGLGQADVNLLAKLLQIAGLREITPQTLIRQGTPLLWEPSVLRANLYGALERVSKPAGRNGGRRLDPERFASREVYEQATAFYPQFFLANGRGDLRLQLVDPVSQRIDTWASQIRSMTGPFLDRHLAGLPDLGLGE